MIMDLSKLGSRIIEKVSGKGHFMQDIKGGKKASLFEHFIII